jgi:hypothetical protein
MRRSRDTQKRRPTLDFCMNAVREFHLDYITADMWYGVGATSDHVASRRMKDLSRVMTARQIVEAKSRAGLWMSAHDSSR